MPYMKKVIRSWRKDAILEWEAENAHFQTSAWGCLTMKHSARVANDEALALDEKSRLGLIFEAQAASERTTRAYSRNLSVLP